MELDLARFERLVADPDLGPAGRAVVIAEHAAALRQFERRVGRARALLALDLREGTGSLAAAAALLGVSRTRAAQLARDGVAWRGGQI